MWWHKFGAFQLIHTKTNRSIEYSINRGRSADFQAVVNKNTCEMIIEYALSVDFVIRTNLIRVTGNDSSVLGF